MLTYRARPKTTRIILHDSHTPNDLPNVTAHMLTMGRAKGLLDVGYHCVIERDGTVAVCRKLVSMGSHTPGNNHDSIGVCLAGSDDFTDAQYDRLENLYRYIVKVYGPLPIVGHYEVQTYRNPKKRPRCPCCDMDEVRQRIECT